MRFLRTLPLLALPLAALAGKPAAKAKAAAAEPVRPVKTFHVYVNDGMWKLADGTEFYIIGYVRYNDNWEEAPAGVQLPSPTLPAPTMRVTEGDEVHVVLHNMGHHHADKGSQIINVPHTIHFHGLDLVQAIDGVPDVPAEGLPDRVFSGVPVGDTYEYRFAAEHEGTYSYHCHVDAPTHILMGMYGAFIVDSKTPHTMYGRHYDREYTLFYSEVDTKHNEAIRTEGTYNMMEFKGDYYLLNGRIFVSNLKNPLSTVADPNSVIVANEGETVLLRILVMSFEHAFVLHPHAYHMQVIGTDGRPLTAPYWKDTLPVQSGERYEVLVPIINKRNKVCLSCGMGKGVSIFHDHNFRGETSNGQYPKGPLTVFVVK